MAATRLIPMHLQKGRSVGQCLKDRTDYAKNDLKTENGEFVSSYECNPDTVDLEFELTKNQYEINTGRGLKDKDVIAYQIRQSFKPGEIAPEEANRIGYETAMRWTKGKHAFIVATHVDKAHIHNHIVYNSTTLDATHKYQNFFLSSFALRRLSDMICLEHGMSVIPEKKPDQWQKRTTYPRKHSKRDDIRGVIDWIFENEKPKDMDEFLRFMVEHGFEIKRGKYISVKAEGQKNHLRLRSLGNGYTDDDIAKRIAGELVVDTGASKVSDDVSDSVALSDSEKKLDLVFDIQNIIAKQKGPGYERWAKIHNVKAISKTLLYLSEHGLKDIDELSVKAMEAKDRFSYISSRQKEIETRMAEIKSLRQHIFNYSKSQDVFAQYKVSGYSKEFFETHRDVLLLRNAAKEAFKKADGQLPSVKALDEEFQKLLQEKRELYAEYKPAKERMQELLMAKQNVERFLNLQEMQEQDFAKKKYIPSL